MLASASADFDVAVIGAGAAGLAAARTLRVGGLRVALLEAGHRIGGRAYTDRPAALGGQRFEHGAQWLHAAHRNPLVGLAQAAGIAVQPDVPWDDRSLIIDPGAPNPAAAYAQAEERWRRTVTARLDGPDTSLAEAAAEVAADPWAPTIEAWEGAIIAAADAELLSLRDWHANALEGENYVAPAGIGALVATCLGPGPAGVRLGVRAQAVTAKRSGVSVRTDQGTLRAGAAIVTVSTGVLRAEAIAFSPALPMPVLNALDGLPMGLLSKIVLRAQGAEHFGLAPATSVFGRLANRSAPFLSTILWADDSDLAVSFVGGRAAWALAGRPDEAAALARCHLSTLFGRRTADMFGPLALCTRWAEDPNFRGAYAYATPGQAGARATLAQSLWDGRLAFAGEACATDGLAGTVAGACVSGTHAARGVLGGFGEGKARGLCPLDPHQGRALEAS